MTNKSYAMNVLIILGVSAVLLLFIFILVAHHRDIPDRVRQDASALRASGASQASVPAAQTQREPAKNAVAAPPPSRDGKK